MFLPHLVLLIALAGATPQAQTVPKEALDGIDPVVLIQSGKEIAGKSEFKITRGPFDYLFSSADTRATFEKQPAKYEIQLGGLCARMGGGASGNPSDYAVVDGKIYIFGSDDCHKRFVAAPEKFLSKPAAPMPAETADRARGRALVDRAAAALGGAALDGLTTYVETSSQTQTRPVGTVAISAKTMWRFPGSVRIDRSQKLQDKVQTSAQLSTPAGAWFIGQGHVYPQNDSARQVGQEVNGRALVPLLRGRHDAGFAAAALGRATVAGVEVDRVRVKNGPVDVTLGIEAASGRVHSLEFTGRNAASEIGAYTIVFGDYRTTGGLTLPFSEQAYFDGAPDDFLTRTIESVDVNPPLDPALFEARAGGGQ